MPIASQIPIWSKLWHQLLDYGSFSLSGHSDGRCGTCLASAISILLLMYRYVERATQVEFSPVAAYVLRSPLKFFARETRAAGKAVVAVAAHYGLLISMNYTEA